MTNLPFEPIDLPPEARRHIGRRLATARKFRGIEPPAIEAALGKSGGFIARLESEDGPVIAGDLHRLMMHLNIGVRFFHDGAPPSVRLAIADTIAESGASGALAEVEAFLKALGGTMQFPGGD